MPFVGRLARSAIGARTEMRYASSPTDLVYRSSSYRHRSSWFNNSLDFAARLLQQRATEAQDAHAALARDRSMRGERQDFLLDRGLIGHGRCGGRGLVPLDRLRLARHRAGEHLVHARDRNDLEPTLDAVRDFDKILGVLFGNEHRLDAPAQGREQLLLETGGDR